MPKTATFPATDYWAVSEVLPGEYEVTDTSFTYATGLSRDEVVEAANQMALLLAKPVKVEWRTYLDEEFTVDVYTGETPYRPTCGICKREHDLISHADQCCEWDNYCQ